MSLLTRCHMDFTCQVAALHQLRSSFKILYRVTILLFYISKRDFRIHLLSIVEMTFQPSQCPKYTTAVLLSAHGRTVTVLVLLAMKVKNYEPWRFPTT
jgi:hypothetical protein